MSLRHIIKHLPSHSLLRPTPLSSLSSAATHLSRPPPSPPQPPHNVQYAQQEPYALMKEDPIQVCSDLWVRTFSDPTHKPFPNLIGFLSKFDLWVLAYQRCCAHDTGSFPPRSAIHSSVLHDLLDLRNAVVRGRFAWNDKARLHIRGPNEKPLTKLICRRKLRAMLESDEPCFQDRLVQEVLLLILEPVFEARFSPKSHAFRPGRNAHSAIRTLRSNFAGYLWFLRGDMSELLEGIDANVVMGCVEEAVKDKKVLGLLKSALRLPGKSRRRCETESELPRKKKKKGSKRKKVLNENQLKPDPYWLRTFFDFAPEEAAKAHF